MSKTDKNFLPNHSYQKSNLKIVKITEADKYVVDNPYLLTGYRKGFDTIGKAFKSILIKHNDLMNIWTHLIAALIFLGFMVHLASGNVPNKFEISSLKEKIVNISHSTGQFVRAFKKDLNPFLSDISSLNDSMKIENLKEYLEKSNTQLNEMKKEYGSRFNLLKNQLEKKEADFIINFGVQINFYLLQLGHFHEEIQKSFLKNGRNNDQDLNESKPLIQATIDKLLENFNSIIPHEDTINQVFSQLDLTLEIYPLFIYFSCAVFCFLASVIFHWFWTISETIGKILNRIDFAGISIMMFGSSYATFYYSFYCMPFYRNLYITLSFILCFSVFIISLGDMIHKPKYMKLKVFMYGGLGITNFLPYFHIVILCFKSNPDNDHLPFGPSHFWLVVMVFVYLIGLSMYTLRFPEKYFPKTFDIWLNSHTLWHVFVLLGALIHFKSILLVYNDRLSKPCLS
jgi:adiponectin receptor